MSGIKPNETDAEVSFPAQLSFSSNLYLFLEKKSINIKICFQFDFICLICFELNVFNSNQSIKLRNQMKKKANLFNSLLLGLAAAD